MHPFLEQLAYPIDRPRKILEARRMEMRTCSSLSRHARSRTSMTGKGHTRPTLDANSGSVRLCAIGH